MTETQYQTLLNGLAQVNQRLDRRLDQVDEHLEQTDRRLDQVDEHLAQTDRRLDQVDEHLAQTGRRLDQVDAHLAQTDRRLDQVDEHLEQMDRRLDQADEHLAQVDQRWDQTQELIRSSQVEVFRHFDVVAERLEHQIGLVAEGVMSLEERFEAAQRQTAAEFALVRSELRSEIRLAFGVLDRRISALEDAAGA